MVLYKIDKVLYKLLVKCMNTFECIEFVGCAVDMLVVPMRWSFIKLVKCICEHVGADMLALSESCIFNKLLKCIKPAGSGAEDGELCAAALSLHGDSHRYTW